jgi:peptide deformylase
LKRQAVELHFPLSDEDKNDINLLEKKFDHETGCAGLAAPQIGISKRIIIFQAPDDENLKKWRQDLTQTMSKTIWLNPSFKELTAEMSEDFEGCFSLPNIAGKVARYKQIQYHAYDTNGVLISGTAEGFLARVIQHEIDHLNGTLFIDHIPKESIIDMEEYRAMRNSAIKAEESINTNSI